jgi:hypothetical protein
MKRTESTSSPQVEQPFHGIRFTIPDGREESERVNL